jgi:Zn-dependent protease with chaperone function
MKKLLAVKIGEEWFLRQNQVIKDAGQFRTPAALISIILKNVYTAAAILFFVLLLFGGISIILGAGGNDPKKAGQGRKAIIAAITGFIVIFASYWIVQIVGFITGIDILNPIL